MKWSWIQLNVGLIRHDANAVPSARALFARLAPLVERGRHEGRLRWFFFMRKPPDVRLRFSTTAKAELTIELRQCALALQQEGVIDRFNFSEYRAEISRFGGSQAMNHVHCYFDADTSMWMELDRKEQQGSRTLAAQVLVPCVLHDLFARALPDEALVLAEWRRLGAMIPACSGTSISEPESLANQALNICSLQSEEKIGEFRCYIEANRLLATSLTGLMRTGVLTCELSEVLATVGLFTFHRHGIGPTSGVLIEGMIRALEPKQATR